MSSKLIKSDLPCPDCGSSDALAEYDDGHTYCFSCETRTGATKTTKKEVSRMTLSIDKEKFKDLEDRGISARVAKKFSVNFLGDDGEKYLHSYPYFNQEGEHVASKLRTKFENPRFLWDGDNTNVTLFGQQAFPPGASRILTITEGECDAMAVYEMFETLKPGLNPAVVSVQSASQAVKDVRTNWQYINSFDEVVICFDADEGKPDPKNPERLRYPGQEAANAVAAMFDPKKVKVLTLSEHKDANDYLRAGKFKKFQKEWWQAPRFTPQGVKLGTALWDEIVNPPTYETIPYPIEGLNKMTYGLRLSEFVVVTAETGIGKTSVLKKIEHHLLKNAPKDAGVGLLHLEETNADTALGLMSIEAQKPMHLPDVREKVTKKELEEYYDRVVNTDRLVIWDHFGSNTVDEVLAVIRHMHAMGCKYIVLDHLSIVVSDHSGDERKQLDEISTKLKMLCMQLNIAVIAVIHLNRQGQIRGTAGVEQIANTILRLERDKTDSDEWRRNCTKITVEKNRFAGFTGPACVLHYDSKTGLLNELDEDETKVFLNNKSVEDFDDYV